MNSSDSSFRYARPLIGLHWLMFLLFIVVYAAMEFRVIYDKGMPERDFMKSLHFMFGLCILLLVVFRLWAKRLSPRPPLLQLHGLAKLMHRASGAALDWAAHRGFAVSPVGAERPAVATHGLALMVRLAGIEPTTLGFGGQYSIH
jgi:hypothetical protein